ncbi:D-alanyl-D-alanine carboxypeptidase/D-alanyl-D-alanine endopeptidase [Sphingomonas endophytica]|uniref:Penicillin-binding protein n=1 Tax=Sphingomonas endophytica TaxID=869719 RepID=A0A147I5G8_9SPHN|nr:D-alanyl-D-alanine carboxypeptidase/D-alanyl-D-alanine-endopeptidase [Sphingomonas endophytica]KTT73888.1 penicillin-binding protein [Sphingomonas endophytica]
MRAVPALLLVAAAPAPPPPAVEQALASAGPGTRIGLVVADADGRELVAIRADERFVPASNTKIFTTAAAFAALDTAAPDAAGGAGVRIDGQDVILTGHGDARLSSAPDCAADCLFDLARAVAKRTRVVQDVIGDDTAFPDERWPLGMSWNNMAGRYGTAASALTIDDNAVAVVVVPTRAGAAADLRGDGYYRLDDRVTTTVTGAPDLSIERLPGSDTLRVTGTIPAGGAPVTLMAGIDDPAHRAAWRLAALLRAAGVHVTGRIRVRHRALTGADDPQRRGAAVAIAPRPAPALAQLIPPPLAEDIRLTNKQSQNLHAELLLRRVAARAGSGSVADGRAAVQALLDRAGVPRWSYDFADGSGMSNYNRVTPRATVRFLSWTRAQPWGAAWRETLPVAAVDGTLARRFVGTPLAGRLFAKTGTLNAATAVSGFMVAASGRTLTFAAFANDMPADAGATAALDRALLAVAAAY